jgi:hypothetical protein
MEIQEVLVLYNLQKVYQIEELPVTPESLLRALKKAK